MSDFFDTTEEELKPADQLDFNDKDIVKFQLIDHYNDTATGRLKLTVKVLTGIHEGKPFKIYVGSGNEAEKKRKNSFLHAFWTSEQINAKQCKPAYLIGRLFTAKCEVQVKPAVEGKPSRRFQNWSEYQDNGAGPAIVLNQPGAYTPPPPQAAPVHYPPPAAVGAYPPNAYPAQQPGQYYPPNYPQQPPNGAYPPGYAPQQQPGYPPQQVGPQGYPPPGTPTPGSSSF